MIHGTAFSAHDMGSFAYLVHKPSGTLLSIPRALYVDLATYPEAYGDGWQAMLDETAAEQFLSAGVLAIDPVSHAYRLPAAIEADRRDAVANDNERQSLARWHNWARL